MVGLLGWLGDRPLPVVRGLQMRRGEWICLGPGMQSSHRTFGPNDFVTLTLDARDLTRAAFELTGCELAVKAGMVLRPPAHLGDRLFSTGWRKRCCDQWSCACCMERHARKANRAADARALTRTFEAAVE
jgi:hypothetical protein